MKTIGEYIKPTESVKGKNGTYVHQYEILPPLIDLLKERMIVVTVHLYPSGGSSGESIADYGNFVHINLCNYSQISNYYEGNHGHTYWSVDTYNDARILDPGNDKNLFFFVSHDKLKIDGYIREIHDVLSYITSKALTHIIAKGKKRKIEEDSAYFTSLSETQQRIFTKNGCIIKYPRLTNELWKVEFPTEK